MKLQIPAKITNISFSSLHIQKKTRTKKKGTHTHQSKQPTIKRQNVWNDRSEEVVFLFYLLPKVFKLQLRSKLHTIVAQPGTSTLSN